MGKMIIATIKIKDIEKVLRLPNGAKILDARRPFDSADDYIEFKLSGVGYETPTAGSLMRSSAKMSTRFGYLHCVEWDFDA
jgi:hypothetical protein